MHGHPELFRDKMLREGLPQLAIDTFLHYYGLVCGGTSGLVRESEIEPVKNDTMATLDDVSKFRNDGIAALDRLAVIKLNGGLGTTMGLDAPKSLLPVRDNRNFLDFAVQQLAALAHTTGTRVALLFMNSFNTDSQTLEYLRPFSLTNGKLPLSFLQHKFPKVLKGSLRPASWPANPRLEWNPPGHGNIYTALVTSGVLDAMLSAGITYACVSNIDNLCASLDLGILGYFAASDAPFLMEVVERTEMDKKGGHLARRRSDGRLVLREAAQVHPDDLDTFRNVKMHSCFNTNNLWLNLRHLGRVLDRTGGVLDLPVICNEKPIDPRDNSSARVYQIETAMGAAISMFADSRTLLVPRVRFSPVKQSEDLLVAQSDCFICTEAFEFALNPRRKGGPATVRLDSRFYSAYDKLLKRFPYGAPSLVECDSLEVTGDVRFGRNVVARGAVRIVNTKQGQASIADNTILDGDSEL